MKHGRAFAVSLLGLAGALVEVEAQISNGLPALRIIGLPDTALSEARDRVRSAVEACGVAWPLQRVTVALSPAELPKAGSGFDLAVAVALLRAEKVIKGREDVVHLGELGLDGRIHPVRGALPAIAAAVAAGRPKVVVPAGNVTEARLVPGAEVVGAAHLAEVIRWYGGKAEAPDLPPVEASAVPVEPAAGALDLADVMGQHWARVALEVAAAGGHHLLMTGPPGTGKTMLARRLPGLLPDLTEEQAVQVTAVHSIAGTFDARGGLIRRPPFEAPHHTASVASLVGGGSGLPRPGSASRAHLGVLFLDESPEFGPRLLDSLRQPLEHGELVLHRARGTAVYPARFQLVLAANPCPCGRAGGKGLDCTCTPLMRRRYFSRLSGPLLDRVDLRVEVEPVTRVQAARPAEPSAAVAQRVRGAREAAAGRLRGTGWHTNAQVPGPWLRARTTAAAPAVTRDLEAQLEHGRISLRGLDRALRVAWTLADLGGRAAPEREDLDLALGLRAGAGGAS